MGALIAHPELLGTASHGSNAASTGHLVTAVVDAVVEETQPDANAGGAATVAPVQVAASAVASSPTSAPAAAEPMPETIAPEPIVPATTPSQVERQSTKPTTTEPEIPAMPASAQAATGEAASASAVSIVNTTTTASVSASQGDMIRYANKVRARLAAHRPAGIDQRGKVVVTFIVSGGGTLDHLEVQGTSGSARLDRMALASVRSAAPFPSPPSAATLKQRTFTIPFEFR